MDRENPYAASGARVVDTGWLSPDVRRPLDALLATAAGTMAGILVDSGFSVRMSIVNAVYRVLGPLFDVFSAFPNGQLVLAGFIHRVPVVLMVGLLIGLILRNFRYPRLLLYSTLVWLVYLVGRKLALALLLMISDGGGWLSWSFFQFQILPELVLYSMQYALLVLVISMTDAVLVRSARRKPASAA
jgi:hypothetical protein